MFFRQWVSGIRPAGDGGEHRQTFLRAQFPSFWANSCRRPVHPGFRRLVRGPARLGRGSQKMEAPLMRADVQPYCGARQCTLGRSWECPQTWMGLGTPTFPPFPVFAAATEALSTPRKWPKGCGRVPLRDGPAPWRPALRPRCWQGLGWWLGSETETCRPERRGGPAGQADRSGGGMTHASRCGCGRDSPAVLQVCTTSVVHPGGAGVSDPAVPRTSGPCGPWRRECFSPCGSGWEIPRGRVLSHQIPGMPPGHPGLLPASRPASPPRAAFPGRAESRHVA